MAKAVASEAYLDACNAAHEVHAGQGVLVEYGLPAHTQMSRTLFHYLGELGEEVVVVRQLSEQRGPAEKARALYEETEASKKAREALSAQLRLARGPAFESEGMTVGSGVVPAGREGNICRSRTRRIAS